MTELSARHEAFVSAYLHDFDGTRAAIAAGFRARSARRTAVRLLAMPEIAAEVAQRQAQVAQTANITLQSLLIEAEENRQVAESNGQASAMVASTRLKAALLGLIDRPDEAAERERADTALAQADALKSAAELLADAAQSLGLPRNATPAQICGATALRTIPTPEVFMLLHENAKAANAE